MAKIRRPSEDEIQEANGNTNDKIEEQPRGDEWLDQLTGDQAERDKTYKDAESGNFTIPRDNFLKSQPVEDPRFKDYKPIPAKELGDAIVDAVYKFIKDGGYSPNWPRVMSSIGYAQQGVKRRWHELLGRNPSKFGGRLADRASKRSLEEKEAQKQTNESLQPENQNRREAEFRGGEAAIAQQPLTQGLAQDPPKETVDQRMGDPVPGVAIPGSEMT